jgi:hypothetical protein
VSGRAGGRWWVDWLADTDARRREEELQIRAAEEIALERTSASRTLWALRRHRAASPEPALERTA